VANHGHELETDKKSGGEDGGQVYDNADAAEARVLVPYTGNGVLGFCC
jgi:hypothetical protein